MKYLRLGGIIIALILILIQAIPLKKSQDYPLKLQMASKAEQAFELIKNEKISRHIPLNDQSGMLGQDFTWITTTLGSKESKTTTTNPNFTLVIYDYLKALHLKEGDSLAVNFSGSFPALNIATIIACEALAIEPIIISSIGASTYGGNDPEMTYLDMEYLLYSHGLITHKSLIFSNGGHNDLGEEMDQDILTTIIYRLEDLGYEHYYSDALNENINHRMALYKDCSALISVGGNMVSQTETDFGFFDSYGYIDASQLRNFSSDGLIGLFLNQGKDVVNLLNIKAIAVEHGLPIDSYSLIQAGEGHLFYERKIPLVLSLLLIITLCVSMIGAFYVRKREIENAVARYISS